MCINELSAHMRCPTGTKTGMCQCSLVEFPITKRN